jgi:hypothetical protein
MKTIDLSLAPSNPEEMTAYAEQLRKELTKAVEENGISEVISLLAMTTASVAYFAKSNQQITEKLSDNDGRLLDIVSELKETMRLNAICIAKRLEDLEGK